MVVFLGEVRVSNNKIKRSRKFENIFTLFLKPWLLNKPLWPFKSLHIAKVLSAPVFLTVSCSWSYKASLIAFKPTLGVWHDDTVMILLAMASLIIMVQSDTLLLSKTFSIHSSERRIPAPPVPFSFSTQIFVTWIFTLYHTCRCTTPCGFLKRTEVYASSGHCFNYFTGSCFLRWLHWARWFWTCFGVEFDGLTIWLDHIWIHQPYCELGISPLLIQRIY